MPSSMSSAPPLLQLLGGLALFLYAMELITRGMKKGAGPFVHTAFSLMGRNRLLGVVVGMGFTGFVQSSAATAVVLMSFAEAGFLTLASTAGALLGAGVGATITGQIIAFNVSKFSLGLVAIGFLGQNLPQRRLARHLLLAVMGLGLLFLGMDLMSSSLLSLRAHPAFQRVLGSISSLPAGIALGLAFSVLVQSSNAAIGLVIAMASQGLLDLPGAMPFILGANIGTVSPAVLSALRMARPARRVLAFYIVYKLVALAVLAPWVGAFTQLALAISPHEAARQIANAHTLFNLWAALLGLPLAPLLVRLIDRLVPERMPELPELPRLTARDARAHVATPQVALAQGHDALCRLGDLLVSGMSLMQNACDGRGREVIAKNLGARDLVKRFRVEISGFYFELQNAELGEEERSELNCQLLALSELLHVSAALARDVVPLVERVAEGVHFSPEGRTDVLTYEAMTRGLLRAAVEALRKRDRALARKVREEKSAQKKAEAVLVFRHLDRLHTHLRTTLSSDEEHMDALDGFRQICTYAGRIARIVETCGEIHAEEGNSNPAGRA